MLKFSNSLRKTIHSQSRVLMDIEVIDARDIVWTGTVYKSVSSEMIGLRKSKTGMRDIRRWWGMLNKFNEGDNNE